MKQLIFQAVIAFALTWAGVFALSGCAVSATQAYSIIHGSN